MELDINPPVLPRDCLRSVFYNIETCPGGKKSIIGGKQVSGNKFKTSWKHLQEKEGEKTLKTKVACFS